MSSEKTPTSRANRSRPYSSVNRLIYWYSSSIFLLLFLVCAYLYWSLSGVLNQENHLILKEHLQTIHTLLNRRTDPVESIRRRIESEWMMRHFQKIYVRVTEVTGKVISESPEIPVELNNRVFPNIKFYTDSSLRGRAIKTKTDDGESFLILGETLGQVVPNLLPLRVVLALNITHEERVLQGYRTRLISVLCLAFLFSIWLGRHLAIAGFKPVNQIVNQVQKIRSSTLHTRIEDGNWSVEIEALATTFNDMIGHLDEAFSRLSRFSADIAHEIRTPLNNIRGEIEVSLSKERTTAEYREVLMSALEEAKRIEKITESLLFLARSEDPESKIKKETIDLQAELTNIFEFYEVSASEAGIRLHLEPIGNIHIEVERTLFQRAIGNLLSNSIEHTPSGGTIRAYVVLPLHNDTVCIAIADSGEGISKEHLPRIFERFYRGDQSRTCKKNQGFGLGLTLVQRIVHLHNGEITVESQPKLGTVIKLTFPRQITNS